MKLELPLMEITLIEIFDEVEYNATTMKKSANGLDSTKIAPIIAEVTFHKRASEWAYYRLRHSIILHRELIGYIRCSSEIFLEIDGKVHSCMLTSFASFATIHPFESNGWIVAIQNFSIRRIGIVDAKISFFFFSLSPTSSRWNGVVCLL